MSHAVIHAACFGVSCACAGFIAGVLLVAISVGIRRNRKADKRLASLRTVLKNLVAANHKLRGENARLVAELNESRVAHANLLAQRQKRDAKGRFAK